MKYYFDIKERRSVRVSIDAPNQEIARDLIVNMYVEDMIKFKEGDIDDFDIMPATLPEEGTVDISIEIQRTK